MICPRFAWGGNRCCRCWQRTGAVASGGRDVYSCIWIQRARGGAVCRCLTDDRWRSENISLQCPGSDPARPSSRFRPGSRSARVWQGWGFYPDDCWRGVERFYGSFLVVYSSGAFLTALSTCLCRVSESEIHFLCRAGWSGVQGCGRAGAVAACGDVRG
jgi:hypothetical protein